MLAAIINAKSGSAIRTGWLGAGHNRDIDGPQETYWQTGFKHASFDKLNSVCTRLWSGADHFYELRAIKVNGSAIIRHITRPHTVSDYAMVRGSALMLAVIMRTSRRVY
jgi:hypothetical protein